ARRDSPNDRIVIDATAPVSPDHALEYVYPIGFNGGSAPATQYYPLKNRKELFVGLQWETSNPWQGHVTNVNKIQFIFAARADITMVMYGPKNGPYDLRVIPQWPEHDGSWLIPNAG